MENVIYLDDWRRAAKQALDSSVVDLTEKMQSVQNTRIQPRESLLNLINDTKEREEPRDGGDAD